DLVRGLLVQRHVAEADGAAPWPMVAHDRPQRRGLARPVPPHQAHHFALAYLEGDTAEDVARLDEHVDVVKREHATSSPSRHVPLPLPSPPPGARDAKRSRSRSGARGPRCSLSPQGRGQGEGWCSWPRAAAPPPCPSPARPPRSVLAWRRPAPCPGAAR